MASCLTVDTQPSATPIQPSCHRVCLISRQLLRRRCNSNYWVHSTRIAAVTNLNKSQALHARPSHASPPRNFRAAPTNLRRDTARYLGHTARMNDTDDPLALFQTWLAAAHKTETDDATAMALATAAPDGRPAVRMVLLKGVDARGFVFYTHSTSPKGHDLAANPRAALCFHWAKLERQVRIEGRVSLVADAEADAYFASRPRLSQIGAWASRQSQPAAGRFELEQAVARETLRFGLGTVPRPPQWLGYRVTPECIEFWQQRAFRHHDRRAFTRDGETWRAQWLFP